MAHVEHYNELLGELGHAIHQFSFVELGLTRLYAAIMKPADRYACQLTLDAARHIETKLRIVEAVADYRLKGTRRLKVGKILNRVRKKASFRNKLAHSSVSLKVLNPSRTLGKQTRFRAVVSRPVSAFFSEANASEIDLQQIKDFSASCHELYSDIEDLLATAKGWRLNNADADHKRAMRKLHQTEGDMELRV